MRWLLALVTRDRIAFVLERIAARLRRRKVAVEDYPVLHQADDIRPADVLRNSADRA